jgi:hypothetical protein
MDQPLVVHPCAHAYLVSFFAAGADFLAGLAGRLLPKEPLNIFPFLVFLSPLPMMIVCLHLVIGHRPE